MTVPIIDVAPLVEHGADCGRVARDLDRACREHGFFAVVGHGIEPALIERLLTSAREFFALDESEKAAIAMARGGRAWRGWFPLGGELTSGRPDRKEGVYFGTELAADDPRVRSGRPLHGANLFPARPAVLRAAVLEYLDACTALGGRLMAGIAAGLGLERDFFARDLTADPTILFRIFHYPPSPASEDEAAWGVAEHTDYGLLTILLQDGAGGLEVRGPDRWTEVAPREDTLVCNVGDMLERMTGGRYRSTLHRVRSPRRGDRLACPFFFDPGWDAEVRPLPLADVPPPDDGSPRWDGANVHALSGTYGDYLLAKVSKVFPELRDDVL